MRNKADNANMATSTVTAPAFPVNPMRTPAAPMPASSAALLIPDWYETAFEYMLLSTMEGSMLYPAGCRNDSTVEMRNVTVIISAGAGTPVIRRTSM